MKAASIILLTLILVLAGCFDDDSRDENLGIEEIVTAPDTPAGPDTVYVGVGETYASGGAVSSEGHALEYCFDFDAAGNHDQSAWSVATDAVKYWYISGTYIVEAQARCSDHISKVSPWSDGKTVTVVPTVPTPSVPTGPSSVEVGEWGLDYYVGGSTSSYWGLIEYRLDFNAEGVRDTVGWQEADPMIGDQARWRKTWGTPGIYVVKGQARSATHPNRQSEWSDGLIVEVVSP